MNEAAVGNAIKKSGTRREELFVTTKLWVQDAGYENARRAFAASLCKLQTDYVDLYLIHQPYGDVHGGLAGDGRTIQSRESKSYRCKQLSTRSANGHNCIQRNCSRPESGSDTRFSSTTVEPTIHVRNNVQIMSWGSFTEGKNNMFSNDILTTIASKYNRSVR